MTSATLSGLPPAAAARYPPTASTAGTTSVAKWLMSGMTVVQ